MTPLAEFSQENERSFLATIVKDSQRRVTSIHMRAVALVASFFTLVIPKDSNGARSFRNSLPEQLRYNDIPRPRAQNPEGLKGTL